MEEVIYIVVVVVVCGRYPYRASVMKKNSSLSVLLFFALDRLTLSNVDDRVIGNKELLGIVVVPGFTYGV